MNELCLEVSLLIGILQIHKSNSLDLRKQNRQELKRMIPFLRLYIGIIG